MARPAEGPAPPGATTPRYTTTRLYRDASSPSMFAYPKFQLSNQEIRALIEEELLPFVEIIRVRRRLAVVRRDPDDDKFLECAVSGRASCLVTGDRDLRELDSFRGITILTAGEFLERMNR